MASAKEFREYADDCLHWAKTVSSDRERAIFLDMARNWREAARRAETRRASGPRDRAPKRWPVSKRVNSLRAPDDDQSLIDKIQL